MSFCSGHHARLTTSPFCCGSESSWWPAVTSGSENPLVTSDPFLWHWWPAVTSGSENPLVTSDPFLWHWTMWSCSRSVTSFHSVLKTSFQRACLSPVPVVSYRKAELGPLKASLCLIYPEGWYNSLSDQIPSQFPPFCSGICYLSFLPASEMLLLPHPSPLSPTSHHPGQGCLPTVSDSSLPPHSNCPTVIPTRPSPPGHPNGFPALPLIFKCWV